MRRSLCFALTALTLVTPAAFAQDGPIRRAGQALDNAGKNARRGVENAVARGQISAQEREILHRVVRRLEWDKQLASSALQLEARPGGMVVLRGSVLDEAVKSRAVDLVQNTVGVTTVVDELAVVKDVKVIQAAPPRIIEAAPPRIIEAAPTTIVVPPETKVIVKP